MSLGRAAPPPVASDVGIVAALSMEVGFLLDRLSKVRKYSGPSHTIIEGEVGGKVVALVVTGMGRSAARLGAERLIDGHRPRLVLSAGFAGALDPGLARYDLVMPGEVLDPEGGRFAIEAGPSRPDGVRSGRLLTVDQIIRTAAEKAALRERTGADLVDMESAAVASACADRGVPFRSIRVISDEAGIDLPPEVVQLMTRSGSYRVGAALRAFWHRPSSVKDLWALYEHAQEAADRLAGFVVGALEGLSS